MRGKKTWWKCSKVKSSRHTKWCGYKFVQSVCTIDSSVLKGTAVSASKLDLETYVAFHSFHVISLSCKHYILTSCWDFRNLYRIFVHYHHRRWQFDLDVCITPIFTKLLTSFYHLSLSIRYSVRYLTTLLRFVVFSFIDSTGFVSKDTLKIF